jgi:phospholipid/cholesterol/gamma-HCH transport system substrate-binding protein
MRRVPSFVPLVGIVVAIIAIVVVVKTSSSGHVLHVQFTDAGQLVTGDRVAVATRPIGKITKLSLTPDGLADVTVDIDDAAWPLHLGTRAEIRLASQVGIANRYIELTPGDVRAPALGDGAALNTNYTRGVVDVDETLDDFKPKVRKDLQTVLQGSEQAIDGVVPQAQQSIEYAAPALAQSDLTLGELVGNPPALRQLLRAGGQVSDALARHANALSDGIEQASTLLQSIDRERRPLAGILTRAPVVLPAATRTLRRVRSSLDRSIRPTLRRLIPVARPLAEVLDRLPTTAQRAVPLVEQLRALLPATTRGLKLMPPLAKIGVPALLQAAKSIEVSQDQFAGLRQYGPDALTGTALIYGAGTGYYDANGHMMRVSIESAADAPGADLNNALGGVNPAQGLGTGHYSRCPGGATEPAPDKSNPRIEDPKICNPKDDVGG